MESRPRESPVSMYEPLGPYAMLLVPEAIQLTSAVQKHPLAPGAALRATDALVGIVKEAPGNGHGLNVVVPALISVETDCSPSGSTNEIGFPPHVRINDRPPTPTRRRPDHFC